MFDKKLHTLSENDFKFIQEFNLAHFKLGVAVVLKYVERFGLFPKNKRVLRKDLVLDIAEQLDISPATWVKYPVSGRSYERHRTQIKSYLGLRNFMIADTLRLKTWLAKHISIAMSESEIEVKLTEKIRNDKILIPKQRTLDKIISYATFSAEKTTFRQVAKLLSMTTKNKIDSFFLEKNSGLLAFLKQDPGRVGLESFLDEAQKLKIIRDFHIAESIVNGIPKSFLQKMKSRFASESLHEIKRHESHILYALFAFFLFMREREIVDDMIDLLIMIVHKIEAKSEKRVTRELFKDFIKNKDKDSMLKKVLSASIESPNEKVSDVVYPIAGGEDAVKSILKALSNGVFYTRIPRK